MELWVKYALVAAVFIAFRDIIMKDLSTKYTYVDYEPFTLEDYNKIRIYIDFNGVLDKEYFCLLNKNDNSSENSSEYKVYTNIYIMENIKKKLNNYFNTLNNDKD